MKNSEIFFYHVDGSTNIQEIDLTPFIRTILRLIFIIKDEILSREVEQFVIKSPYGKAIVNKDAVKIIKNIFSGELFGGVNKLDVYDIDVYDDTEFIWKQLD